LVEFMVVAAIATAAIWIRLDAVTHSDADGKARYFWQARATAAEAKK
jgi:hypothetical protein